MVNFETPTAALLTRLGGIDGIEYVTRELEDWDNTPPAIQPSLMLLSGPIDPFVPNGGVLGLAPPMWKMKLLAVVYVQVPSGKTETPSEILNPLVAGVCNALLKQSAETRATGAQFPANLPGQFSTTLGGLCQACYVAGTIDRQEGLVGRVAVANIPIEMVLTS